MKTKSLVVFVVAVALVAFAAQQSDVLIKITQGERAAIAVPDFRGSGEAQKFMDAFNQILFSDLEASGLFRMVPKTMYPLETPQRPQDFRPPLVPSTPARRGAAPQPVRQGPWLTDWSEPPVSATYLAFGYSGRAGRASGGLRLGLQRDPEGPRQRAGAAGKMYFGTLDEEGARKTAHEFAADILAQFGYKSLLGTKIYFESNRSRSREIWSMDPDGSNQKQLTFYKSISMRPAISPDGTMLAFTTDVTGGWLIRMQSLVTGGRLPFYNPPAALNAYPDFTPDGKRIVFSSNLAGEGGQTLHRQRGRQRPATADVLTVHRHRAESESEDRQRNRLCVRTLRDAADLQDEHRRSGRPAADRRRGRSGQPGLASRRPAHCLLLDPRLRSGELQHFCHGCGDAGRSASSHTGPAATRTRTGRRTGATWSFPPIATGERRSGPCSRTGRKCRSSPHRART